MPIIANINIQSDSKNSQPEHSYDAALASAERLREKGDFAACECSLIETIRCHPHEFLAYLKLLDIYISNRKYLEATDIAKKGIVYVPYNPDIFLRYCEIALHEAKYEEALSRLSDMEKVFPDYPYLVARRAEAWLGLKEFEKAKAICKAGFEKFPKHIAIWKAYADIFMHACDYKEAAELWKYIREFAPKRQEGYIGGMVANTRLGRYQETDRIFEAGIKIFPKSRTLLLHWIDNAKIQGNFELAQQRLDEARKIIPTLQDSIFAVDFKHAMILANPYFDIRQIKKTGIPVTNVITTRYYKQSFCLRPHIKTLLNDQGNKQDYLASRGKIFKNCCFPSVISQLGQKDLWLLIVSDPYKKMVLETLPNLPQQVQIVNQEEHDDIFNDICAHATGIINSIRLDNDDAISCDFLELSANAIMNIGTAQGIINFPHGLQFNKFSGCNTYVSAVPHFISIFTNLDMCQTPVNVCATGDHGLIFSSGYHVYTILTSLPMWIENIHNSNQMNTIHSYGKIKNPEKMLRERFNFSIC